MSDLFDDRTASPMLLYQTLPFDDKDYIFELKLDGIRCLAYLDHDKTELRNKRNKDVSDVYPELKDMYKCADKRCILDGELVCLDNAGKPDFFALQKRSLMSDNYKIELAAKRNPVEFVAYDILYLDNRPITNKPLTLRKSMLEDNIEEKYGLSLSRYVQEKGKEFFELAKSQGLEGVVAKKKDGLYYPGKRTREWLKIKVMADEDVIVCGYKPKDSGSIKDLIVGLFSGDKLISRGSVSLGISKEDERKVLNYASNNIAKKPWFDEYSQ